jgi:UDP-glucose 4-epimerase
LKRERKVAEVEDYTSANTHRLTDEELKAMLVKLDYIQQELQGNWPVKKSAY